MSSYSIGKLDHHKRRYIKTFMHFGSSILGDGKAETSPILRVVTLERGIHYPHCGGTSEFFSRKHFPHFGGDVLYIAMYVGKIKRSPPAPKRADKAPKIAVAPPGGFRMQGKPAGGIYMKPVSFRGCVIKCAPFCVPAGIYRGAAYIFRLSVRISGAHVLSPTSGGICERVRIATNGYGS